MRLFNVTQPHFFTKVTSHKTDLNARQADVLYSPVYLFKTFYKIQATVLSIPALCQAPARKIIT